MRRGVGKLQRGEAVPPWWTEADQAEFDLLVREFVGSAFVHRELCSTCRGRGPWCAPLADAFAAVEEWREDREFRSKAQWLRTRQTAAEERAA
jgi:hypothetical protein